MQVKNTGQWQDHMMRQTRQHHVQLSVMADMKANMLLTICALIITFATPHLSDPRFRLSVAVVLLFSLLTILLSIYAVMPKLRLPVQDAGLDDVQDPSFNLLFFGDFVRLPYGKYERAMERMLSDANEVYEHQVRELYTMGMYLAHKKYRYLRMAYITFGTGLVAAALALAVSWVVIEG